TAIRAERCLCGRCLRDSARPARRASSPIAPRPRSGKRRRVCCHLATGPFPRSVFPRSVSAGVERGGALGDHLWLPLGRDGPPGACPAPSLWRAGCPAGTRLGGVAAPATGDVATAARGPRPPRRRPPRLYDWRHRWRRPFGVDGCLGRRGGPFPARGSGGDADLALAAPPARRHARRAR
ncbi:hypothetical protein EMIHUDRAFT_440454, partial [Emiliania huxleyi CCMP1516]|uniref:Uncharacterized protein n=2 Tax=Emiliania huxleyi TaxID=2903 RepID=A0A0D3KN12_EMIH1